MMLSTADPFTIHAPTQLDRWVARFDPQALPVLVHTAQAIETFREAEDQVDARMLGEAISLDPLMTLKLMAHVARLRRGRDGTDPETVTEALVLLGISPFFRAFAAQPTVQDRLAHLPRSLAGFEQVYQRSRRAARFALGFAVHRMDPDAGLIYEAALLHDFAELLLWLEAPTLALRIAERQRADPSLRSADVQREVLNITLAELQQALMRRWRLPRLLVHIDDDSAVVETLQMRIVRLAIRVARHSAHGWEDAALPDDLSGLCELLQLTEPHVLKLLLDIDADG